MQEALKVAMATPRDSTEDLGPAAILATARTQLEDAVQHHVVACPWPLLEGGARAPPASVLPAAPPGEAAAAAQQARVPHAGEVAQKAGLVEAGEAVGIEGCVVARTEGAAIGPPSGSPVPARAAAVRAQAEDAAAGSAPADVEVRPEDAACKELLQRVVDIVGGALGRLRRCDRREIAMHEEARTSPDAGDEVCTPGCRTCMGLCVERCCNRALCARPGVTTARATQVGEHDPTGSVARASVEEATAAVAAHVVRPLAEGLLAACHTLRARTVCEREARGLAARAHALAAAAHVVAAAHAVGAGAPVLEVWPRLAESREAHGMPVFIEESYHADTGARLAAAGPPALLGAMCAAAAVAEATVRLRALLAPMARALQAYYTDNKSVQVRPCCCAVCPPHVRKRVTVDHALCGATPWPNAHLWRLQDVTRYMSAGRREQTQWRQWEARCAELAAAAADTAAGQPPHGTQSAMERFVAPSQGGSVASGAVSSQSARPPPTYPGLVVVHAWCKQLILVLSFRGERRSW